MTESLRTPSTPGVSSGASFPSSRGASESYSDGTHRKVAEHDCFSPTASSFLSQPTIPSIQPAYDFWTVLRVMQTFDHACISCAQDSESLEAMEDYETASKAPQSVIDQYSTLSRETRSALDVGIEAWTVTATRLLSQATCLQVPLPTTQSALSPALSKRAHLPPRTSQPVYRSAQEMSRPLNIKDALGYLDAVKEEYKDRRDVYERFLDTMKDFKNNVIDTPGVIRRVSVMFHGKPQLIQGFNTFLPVGYHIETSADPHDHTITVITPSGTTQQSTEAASLLGNIRGTASGNTNPNSPASSGQDPDFNHAIQYLNKVKARYAVDEENTYKQFLEILQAYKREGENSQDSQVYLQVKALFKDSPDLVVGFENFLPDAVPANQEAMIPTEPQQAPFFPEPTNTLGNTSPATASATPRGSANRGDTENLAWKLESLSLA
ncbi:hypothetical protein NMY22_g10725 [Coprinellus aureogranulatus]|nr:hypothetical protein NMY22_g10725 [Coprinellus aureogranulatus]